MENYLSFLEYEINSNPHFNPFLMYIKINSSIADYNDIDPDSIIDFSVFIHEYTHYIQLTCTNWGVNVFFEYLEYLHINILEIYNNYKRTRLVDNSIFIRSKEKYYQIKNRYHYHLCNRKVDSLKNNGSDLLVRKMNNRYTKKHGTEVYVCNKYLNEWVNISPFVLMENMSTMAYLFIRNIGLDSATDFFELQYNDMTPDNKAKYINYWVIYLYFHDNYPQISDKIIFTYYFCEICLMNESIGEYAHEYLDYIKIELVNKNYIYKNADDFFNHIDKKYHIWHHISLKTSRLKKIIDDYKEKIQVDSKINNFIKLKCYLLDIISKGLNYRLQHTTMFNARLDSTWINNLKEIIYSPPIIQKDGTVVTLKGDDEYFDSILLFNGITILMEKIMNEEKINSCPFYKDFKICVLPTKDENICLNSPVEANNDDEKACIYTVASFFLGIVDTEEFRRQYG